jgi:CzcA family heavy metal efflux pump
MLNWLVQTSLQLRVVVIALAAVLLLAGIQIVSTTPLDVFPEFAPPLVEIQTEAPGLSTAEVESLVTVPIENAVNGTSWLATMRSKSVLGLSSVVLIFEPGTDLLRARQLVQERLATLAGQLPAVARAPVLLAPLSSTSRVMKIGITSKKFSQMELSTLTRWTIRPRLMAVPGVANVAIWGQRDRQIQVRVDPDRLHANGVTLDQVLRAAREAVSLGAGGFVDTPNQRLAVMHLPAITDPAHLAQVPVAFRSGAPLRLGDVAEVVEGFPPPIGDAVVNDGPGLLLIVEKQPWGNTLEVTQKVEAALDAMRPGLAEVEIDSTIFRPATFIEMSLQNLRRALVIGILLVMAILAAFLFEWRTAVISLLAIPLSLLAAALVLHYRGGTMNAMILAGLVIALGEVVDDAIIDVENIMRRLRLNRAAANPEPAMLVVLKASLEVRSAIVFASLVIVLVFLPVFLLPGLAGSFFRPLAVAYVLAVLASLGVALTLTPALSLVLLPGALHHRESPLVTWLKGRYRSLLPRFVERPKLASGILAVLFVATAAAVPLLGEEFLPNFKEYDFLMHWVGKPGASLEAMQRITIQASKELRSIPGVRNFGAHIGRAEVADEVVGPNFTELWISLDPTVNYESTVAKIQEVVDGYPGLYRDLLTYLKERIKEVLTGAGATIVVRIYGPGLDELRSLASETARAISEVPDITDLKVEPQVLVPQVEVQYRHDVAQRFGLTPGDVRRGVTTLVQGSKVGEIFEEQKIFDVVVRGAENLRTDPVALSELRIDTPGGGSIPLREVAGVHVAPTPNVIQREGASRRIDVSCNVRGRDLGSVAREIEAKVRALPFPQGYHPEFVGEYAARQQARNRLLALGALSLLGIFLLLHADFRSTRLALLVFVSLPFALVGGVFAAFLTGGVLSLGSLVGFVTVLGIAARNGIMLVSHYRHLAEHEGMAPGRALILRGSEERLAPILMTALATALALLPLALGGNKPGHEIEHPMAVVILGGLVTSTVLNLFLLPALSLRFAFQGEPQNLASNPLPSAGN